MPQSPQVGDRAEYERLVTAEDIQKFAEVTGDTNPLHRDAAFAAKTRFGEPIAHGMLSAGYISTAVWRAFRSEGVAVYLSQTLRFLRPVKVGDTIKAVAEVKGIDAEKGTYTLETICYNQGGDPVVKGEAVVLLDQIPP